MMLKFSNTVEIFQHKIHEAAQNSRMLFRFLENISRVFASFVKFVSESLKKGKISLDKKTGNVYSVGYCSKFTM